MIELWCTFWGHIRQGGHLEQTFVAIPARLDTHLRFDFYHTHAIGLRCATWILR
ncbi:hypothetical protein M422DRAFT_29432 [Sphaerobolus stellatus SS14]|uniref:Uncharacterized protein n=1 Tax=Sphaerobolus stellatus (strain SS14) TaxID=990650 RepID=A0A0C9W2W9_SPHS4|nr:hypothetical protein M422DRAFT_29432 [Sphaerobolus stellatus SS14]